MQDAIQITEMLIGGTGDKYNYKSEFSLQLEILFWFLLLNSGI